MIEDSIISLIDQKTQSINDQTKALLFLVKKTVIKPFCKKFSMKFQASKSSKPYWAFYNSNVNCYFDNSGTVRLPQLSIHHEDIEPIIKIVKTKIGQFEIGFLLESYSYLEAKEKYKNLLRKLHIEMKEGRGDDQVADDLRDQMDEPWYDMTEEQREECNLLSEELYKQDGM